MGIYLDDTQTYLFNTGENAYAYEALGCHVLDQGARFAVWAPNARQVYVCGDWNGWSPLPLSPVGHTGVWQAVVPEAGHGMLYKYAVDTWDGRRIIKADPFAFHSETRPGTASRVWAMDYRWGDGAWQDKRAKTDPKKQPMSIYEVHLASWRGEKNYRDLALELADYVTNMGYTHVELLPLSEHPLDASWGYQTTGYFAATSRFGTPQDLMYLVDLLHQRNIGVIFDWVPAHYPKDDFGLAYFDGGACYEHIDSRRAEQPQWGTLLFDYEKPQVRSFLMSAAVFWAKVYHADGLRTDAVSCMLYLDYGKEQGQWLPNKYGGRENIAAIDFLKRTSQLLYRDFPGFIFAAEESTSWPYVTRPAEEGGLGFNFKWNMGFMHDMLEYMEREPIHRQYHHNLLTFSMVYAFSESFILPFSHDEVVHGKKSMLDKMTGDYWQKFASLRLLLGYMFAHPGKKLNFMGAEIGQFIEWRFYEPLEWNLLDYPIHKALQDYTRELNGVYLKNAALWSVEDSWEGFEWLDVQSRELSTVVFARYSRPIGDEPRQVMVCVFNFTPVAREWHRVPLPQEGIYREILNSDAQGFSGSGVINTGDLPSQNITHMGKENSLALRIPPLGAVYLALIQSKR